MRVMVVSNIFPPHVRGGYELGLLEVARAFVAAGHDVEVVTSRAVGMLRKVRPVRDIPVREVFAPVLAYEPDLHERLDGSSVWQHYRTDALGGVDVANATALDTEIRRFAPDRIWIGNPLGIGPVSILETTLTAGVPVVVHLMDDVDRYLLGYRRPLSWLARVRRLRRSLTAVSCSTLVREQNSVVGEYARHVVVPNGFDFSSLPGRARPGRHDGPLRLVYFGQVEPMKGVSQLIEGVGALIAEPGAPAVTLDIIGPASAAYADALHADIRSRGLDQTVRLLGRMEKSDLLARLESYDVAVMLLKLDEPFGYAWLEAAAAGLPVVVTRGRTMADMFPEDYPLFIEDRDQPDLVAHALRWCVTHRPALMGLARSLRKHLAGRCDTSTVVNPKYEVVLQTAAAPVTPTNIETLLAAAMTSDSFALAQDGFRCP